MKTQFLLCLGDQDASLVWRESVETKGTNGRPGGSESLANQQRSYSAKYVMGLGGKHDVTSQRSVE